MVLPLQRKVRNVYSNEVLPHFGNGYKKNLKTFPEKTSPTLLYQREVST